jgi:hypothetical protein
MNGAYILFEKSSHVKFNLLFKTETINNYDTI